MRDQEIVGLWESYNQIYQEIDEQVDGGIDTYDEILEYLLGEGYTEEESNQIMV